MELRYPIVFVPVILLAVVAFLIARKKIAKFSKGSKIANTKFVEKSTYYQKVLLRYKIVRGVIYGLFVVVFICAATLCARPSSVHTIADEEYNRDIMLCMDVSGSVLDLNYDLVKSLRKTVSELHGERFGVSIFNTTSIVLSPLTDDYKFLDDVLAQVGKSIDMNNSFFSNTNDDDWLYTSEYIMSGTTENYEELGSSLISDGLASCIFDFPELNKDTKRTRIIIFSTDNDLLGTPLLSLEEAAEIAKKKNILVFGIGTKNMTSANRDEFVNAVNITGGRYYEHSNSTADSIIKDIEATSKTVLKSRIQTRVVDMPQVPFFFMLVSFALIVFLSRWIAE